MSLGADDERQLALLERLRKGRPHLSAERALSGPGLAELYQAVAASHGLSPDELQPNDVIVRGLGAEDEIAVEALELFIGWLGRFAGDAALLLGARGGVYLGGGIAPKLTAKLASGPFRQAFEDKGPHGGLSRADPGLCDPRRFRHAHRRRRVGARRGSQGLSSGPYLNSTLSTL